MLRSKGLWTLVLAAMGAASACTVTGVGGSSAGAAARGEDPPYAERAPGGQVVDAAADRAQGTNVAGRVELGRKLTITMGCNDCHTPWVFNEKLGAPAPDRTRLLSGHPAGTPGPKARPDADAMMIMGATGTSFSMPFGVIYAPNLTPDEDTGIGSWTERMFLDVFRKGTHMGGGGRPVLPPMPWPNIAALDDEEILSIYAYLRSLPPVHNGVPTLTPPKEVMDGVSRTNEEILREMADRPAARKTAGGQS